MNEIQRSQVIAWTIKLEGTSRFWKQTVAMRTAYLIGCDLRTAWIFFKAIYVMRDLDNYPCESSIDENVDTSYTFADMIKDCDNPESGINTYEH